jgi:murein DD-endopeptidase MepM/ murein hydrolase activator NlpD
MDFVAKVGTPIYATADGVISVVEYGNTGYGNHVVISHDYGYQTIYGHMNDIAVKKNQKIRRGELIGTVGNTGLSTGPHLHYEVVNNGKPVNPINYYFNDITPEQYDQMLKVANSVEKSMD